MKNQAGINLWLFYGVSFVSVLALSVSIYLFMNQQKTAYVYNTKILDQYKGVVEMRSKYQEQLSSWQANMDTLTAVFKKEVMEFERDKHKMSAAGKISVEKYLNSKQEELYRYKSALEQKAKEEEVKYNKTVLDQINQYTVEYGKASGYDYVFGVTEDGNILYAKDADDITDAVLIYLNQKYEGIQ